MCVDVCDVCGVCMCAGCVGRVCVCACVVCVCVCACVIRAPSLGVDSTKWPGVANDKVARA